MIELTENDALIVVDLQNDFVSGALTVPNAELILPVVKDWILRFWAEDLEICVTKDWHPEDHCSFETWPKHCVQDTWGADIHADIRELFVKLTDILEPLVRSFKKGESADKEEYSGFDNKELEPFLVDSEKHRLFICGLATDYCVKATAMDALNLGYEVVLIADGMAGVQEETTIQSLGELVLAGAKVI